MTAIRIKLINLRVRAIVSVRAGRAVRRIIMDAAVKIIPSSQ